MGEYENDNNGLVPNLKNRRKIGTVNVYGEICLTDSEIQALLKDFNLLEDEDIEWINKELNNDREAIVFNKINNPYFTEYIKNLLISPIEVVQRKYFAPLIQGGVIYKIDYYRKKQCKNYYDIVMYHYNMLLLNEIQNIIGPLKPDLKPQQETEREKEYFAKAIEAGLMEETDSGYKWLHNNGMKASLGYFLKCVFDPKGTERIPFKSLEALFGVARLDTVIRQVLDAKNNQKWRKDIDILFED